MPEVPAPREHHGEPGLVGGADDLVVAHRAAGLDHRRRAGLGRRQEPVGEGEEGVGGDDRALGEAFGEARRPSRPPRPSRRRCARNRPGSSGRRRCRPSRRPWRRRWRSTSRAWRPGRRSAGRRARGSVGARCVTTFRSMSSTTALSRACTRKPPATVRSASPARAGRAGRRRAAGAGSSSRATIAIASSSRRAR